MFTVVRREQILLRELQLPERIPVRGERPTWSAPTGHYAPSRAPPGISRGPDEDLALQAQIDDCNGNWITFEYDETGTPIGIVYCSSYYLKLTTSAGRIAALHLAGAGAGWRVRRVRTAAATPALVALHSE
ncbi:hypothetical protein ACFRMN_37935 [Streptomyces sp. NPDC056835]|uniref:hypothetical protein n=1 Tax=Streptomyces sp. NPDC056835 TaxID=3345956 RepID=UPI003698ABA1